MRKKLMCLLAAMTFAASYGAENITTDESRSYSTGSNSYER